MKYMGSKRSMLSKSLGEILLKETKSCRQFADLFVGSGAVAWFVAEKSSTRVIASDLQLFAQILAESIIARTQRADAALIWETWKRDALNEALRAETWEDAVRLEKTSWENQPWKSVEIAREISAHSHNSGITQAYGGYYFSPKQAVLIDALRATLPANEELYTLCLAAVICAASECAAAPGHTAQPFKPTPTASRFLFEAWHRDVFTHTFAALQAISTRYAQHRGHAVVNNAINLANDLSSDDVAFVDPPYSGVHYSRFYHVLETLARGRCSDVSGEGRYPPPDERPKSDFSIQTKSRGALDTLLSTLAQRGVRTILTFPKEITSNGLSGEIVEQIAASYFHVSKVETNGRFSTLGGNSRADHRSARIPAYEIILTLRPK